MHLGPANFAVDTDYAMPWLSLHGLGRGMPMWQLERQAKQKLLTLPITNVPHTAVSRRSLRGFGDYVDGMGISVDVKIPRSITEAAKLAPSIAHEFPLYGHELEKQAAQVTSTVDAVNTGLQSLGVALVFGGVIAILLLREKGN